MKTKKSQPQLKNPRIFVIVLAILAFLGLLFYFKNQIVVAWVNGRPIWKLSYSQELNRLAGQQALNSVITKTLITSEAKKQKVSVANNEIQAEISRIEDLAKQQGTDLNELLTLQGMTRQDLTEDIKLNKLVEKMAGTESAQIQDWLTNLQTQAKIIKWVK
ncbi:MAG: SurA N-terminal domain-containing protein [Candidatus Beckwithbacteria bacterium]|nr:SurA N-terminal domain-containing protein [Candidatus Beckwithbacteria bacterium]